VNGPDGESFPAAAAGPPDTYAEQGAALVRERSELRPRVALVLGSGLGDAVAGDVRPGQEFVYRTLPGFPDPSVPGHAGRLVMGQLYGVPSAVFMGRVHFYEGHGIGATTLIPRLAAALGVRTFVLTNAAGGLHPSLRPGQLMLIEDHINLMGINPLFSWRLATGAPAFVDLSRVYDGRLLALAEEVAGRRGVDVRRGVYVALSGPSYETKAEIRMLASLGADAVGMSTVPEAAAAAALGCSVLAISCITNVAAEEPTHQEVLDVAKSAAGDLQAILQGVLPALATASLAGQDERGAAQAGQTSVATHETTGGSSGL
jgi:purine-nucleoside phosphorylase